MAYDNEKLKYGKEHINVIELDLDYCSLTSGVGACTATETGDSKCYNTFGSCNALTSYTKTTKTYRFCADRSPHPIGLDAIPSLDSVNISPTKIDLKGGLGVRASVSLTFRDHPSSDIDIDKYVNDRKFIALERGSFWTKLRARNSNYQFRELRVLSGYLVNGVFDAANFTTRYYIIDKLDVSGGKASITAKDPLKLASNNKAQAPKPSTGQLSGDITNTTTTATLKPTGVGNSEYPASGKVLINSEVMSFTRSGDSLTLTRAQNNTVATEHSANDTVQLCLEYNGVQVHDIVKNLLLNYSNVNTNFISDSAWQAEIDTYLSGLLTGIIVKPFDVNKLLKELSQAMPHYLWWDERTQLIQLTALKAPVSESLALNMDSNFIKDSLKTKDKTDMRISTVFVNFGQFDPTKRLDEISNYRQSYARIDSDSIVKYGSSEIKVINSRWISNTNKAAALQLAALIGRRFSDTPREVTFSLEAKDSSIWTGQTKEINHRDITDFSGLPVNTSFQITSAKENGSYNYSGIEFTYGGALPEDQGGGETGVDLVIIGSDLLNANMRTIYNGLFPTPTATTKVKFIVEGGVKVGSSSFAGYSLDTGSFPTGAEVTLQINSSSYVVGKGGDGGKGGLPGSYDGENGSPAIILNHPLTLLNNGIIGGGGGGGGTTQPVFAATGHGGGGAGYNVGIGSYLASNGTTEFAGEGYGGGGNGGDLGQNGFDGDVSPLAFGLGGAAGNAINKNGFTLTATVADLGDIRGSIIA